MSSAPLNIPVFVLTPPRVLLFDVAGALEALRTASLEREELQFEVNYVGPIAQVRSSVGLNFEGVAALPLELPDGAWVFAPGTTDFALGDETFRDEGQTAQIVDWLKRVVRPGVRLISFGVGAVFAARAGLLDGYACTTDPTCLDAFARSAPTARVLRDRLFVADGDRLTSAGASSGIDVALHLIAEVAGPRVALAVARRMALYLRAGGGDLRLSPWLENRNHFHAKIHLAQDAITADPTKPWSVEMLAALTGASPRNLSRLFNAHAGCTVAEYVSSIRVALARELLAGPRLDMNTVAERAGFASARQMRRAWGRTYNAPPNAERDRRLTTA